MREIKLKIETLPVADLVPYAGNAKKHPEEQVRQIAASIEEFGNCDPIAVWTNANGEPEIVEGHGRLMALESLGVETAPVIYLDHLSDEQRRAYVHVHNQTTLSSGFDMDALKVDIGELQDFDWECFGFEDALDSFTAVDLECIEEDEAPEIEKNEATSKAGDVWQLGKHRLVCGDSTDPETFRKLMGDDVADLLLTDPPYNVALGSHDRPDEARQLHRRTDGLVIANDSWENDEAFVDFLSSVYGNCLDGMRPRRGILHLARKQPVVQLSPRVQEV